MPEKTAKILITQTELTYMVTHLRLSASKPNDLYFMSQWNKIFWSWHFDSSKVLKTAEHSPYISGPWFPQLEVKMNHFVLLPVLHHHLLLRDVVTRDTCSVFQTCRCQESPGKLVKIHTPRPNPGLSESAFLGWAWATVVLKNSQLILVIGWSGQFGKCWGNPQEIL